MLFLLSSCLLLVQVFCQGVQELPKPKIPEDGGQQAPRFQLCEPRNWTEEFGCWLKFDETINNGNFFFDAPPSPPNETETESNFQQWRQHCGNVWRWQEETFKPFLQRTTVSVCQERTADPEGNDLPEPIPGVMEQIHAVSAANGVTELSEMKCCNVFCHCKANVDGTFDQECGGLMRPGHEEANRVKRQTSETPCFHHWVALGFITG